MKRKLLLRLMLFVFNIIGLAMSLSLIFDYENYYFVILSVLMIPSVTIQFIDLIKRIKITIE